MTEISKEAVGQRLHIALDEIRALEDRVADLRGTLVERNDRCIELERRLVNQRSAQAQVLAGVKEALELGEIFAELVERWWWEEGSVIEVEEDGTVHRREEPDEADSLCTVLNVGDAIRCGNPGEMQCVIYADGQPTAEEELERRLIAAGKAFQKVRTALATLNPSDPGQADANPKLGAQGEERADG